MNTKESPTGLALPFVLVNMAMTADGKIATANRAVSSFGSRHDRWHLLELRATADAVLAGARTVDSSPIDMGPGAKRFRRLRLERGLAEYNLRIIASGSGTLNPAAHVFTKRFSPIIVLTTERMTWISLKKLRSLARDVRSFGRQEINFREAFGWLRAKWGVKRLLCEGGGEVNDGLFRSGLVDELHLTVCPLVFGGRGAPTVADGEGFASLVAAQHFELEHTRRHGDELFLVYRRR